MTISSQGAPNIVFIITDDQSWDTLGFLGGRVHTPRLDAMAKDGMYLNNFNVTTTVCSPSRYSYLTGRFAGRCAGPQFMALHPPGVQTQVENINEVELDQPNLPRLLQQHGYRTGFVGKTHAAKHEWMKTKHGITWSRDADPRDPAVNAALKANHEQWRAAVMEQGFEYADGIYAGNLRELHNQELNVHNWDWTVDHSLRFLDSLDERPFFLHVATTLHHGPGPGDLTTSLGADPRLSGEGYLDQAPQPEGMPSREQILEQNRAAGYSDDTAFAYWYDQGVGAIIDKVTALGLSDNTLFVVTTDHGSYRHGKATLHDYGMRVPMLCQWPQRIAAGSRSDHLTANIDWAPTVLDLCDIRPPDDYHYDGVSFAPVLLGHDQAIRDSLLGEMGHSRCIKTDKWKYIAIRYPADVQAAIAAGETSPPYLTDDPGLERPYLTRNRHLGHYASQKNPHYWALDQLYDLEADPEETVNVADQQPQVVNQLQAELRSALAGFDNRPFGEFA